ncbi:ATP-binding protein [Pseudomonas mangiferae]|uniref:histidine kinase n=1 Tax=Pseudomonas mangiferae TaxID=2593654 RepID=A0A553GUP8_9PSED|nr:ATP-binding protein [Pseudomonas mangiferae]TRX73223.1 response regulator [Pseudomonas mangiferae]
MTSESPLLPAFPAFPGEMATLIRRFDWSTTGLGPLAEWPGYLRTSVDLILAVSTPIVLMVGRPGVLIYNDAYAATVAGDRHPGTFGVPVEDAWPEIAGWNRHVLDLGLRGESLSYEDLHFVLPRRGRPDDSWMNVYYSPVYDEIGTPAGVMCIIVENTDKIMAERGRAEAETELRLANERVSLALNAGAVIGTWVWDIPTNHFVADERFARAFSLDPAQAAQGLTLEQVVESIHPEDRPAIEALIAHTLRVGGPYRAEYRVRQLDGTYRWIEANGECQLDAYGLALRFPGVLIDIHERKQTETTLRDLTATLEQRVAEAVAERTLAEERLRQAQKMEAIGQLTGGIAHDFNNLLAGVIGSLTIVQRRLHPDTKAEVQRFLEAANHAAQRGASLVQRMLAFARRQSLDNRPTDINALVHSLEEMLRRTLGERVILETRLQPGLWSVLTDMPQLESALLNLAINARDAMPHGGRLSIVTGNLSLGADHGEDHDLDPGDYVRVEVSDTGTGMDAEVLSHVFEPFFTTKPIGQGTGLGLSMVYGFVKQTGGHIRLSSTPGRGTRFRLYFPRHADAAAAEAEAAALPHTPSGGGERILVVEDDPVVRMLTVEVLEDLGYQVLQASDGLEALETLRREPFDLLLTDVGLPGMNGRQLAESVRQVLPEVPVLFATGYAEGAETRAGFLDEGMEMIAKPYTIDVLAATLRAMLERRA